MLLFTLLVLFTFKLVKCTPVYPADYPRKSNVTGFKVFNSISFPRIFPEEKRIFRLTDLDLGSLLEISSFLPNSHTIFSSLNCELRQFAIKFLYERAVLNFRFSLDSGDFLRDSDLKILSKVGRNVFKDPIKLMINLLQSTSTTTTSVGLKLEKESFLIPVLRHFAQNVIQGDLEIKDCPALLEQLIISLVECEEGELIHKLLEKPFFINFPNVPKLKYVIAQSNPTDLRIHDQNLRCKVLATLYAQSSESIFINNNFSKEAFRMSLYLPHFPDQTNRQIRSIYQRNRSLIHHHNLPEIFSILNEARYGHDEILLIIELTFEDIFHILLALYLNGRLSNFNHMISTLEDAGTDDVNSNNTEDELFREVIGSRPEFINRIRASKLTFRKYEILESLALENYQLIGLAPNSFFCLFGNCYKEKFYLFNTFETYRQNLKNSTVLELNSLLEAISRKTAPVSFRKMLAVILEDFKCNGMLSCGSIDYIYRRFFKNSFKYIVSHPEITEFPLNLLLPVADLKGFKEFFFFYQRRCGIDTQIPDFEIFTTALDNQKSCKFLKSSLEYFRNKFTGNSLLLNFLSLTENYEIQDDFLLRKLVKYFGFEFVLHTLMYKYRLKLSNPVLETMLKRIFILFPIEFVSKADKYNLIHFYRINRLFISNFYSNLIITNYDLFKRIWRNSRSHPEDLIVFRYPMERKAELSFRIEEAIQFIDRDARIEIEFYTVK